MKTILKILLKLLYFLRTQLSLISNLSILLFPDMMIKLLLSHYQISFPKNLFLVKVLLVLLGLLISVPFWKVKCLYMIGLVSLHQWLLWIYLSIFISRKISKCQIFNRNAITADFKFLKVYYEISFIFQLILCICI